MTAISELTKKDIQVLPQQELDTLGKQARKQLLQAFGKKIWPGKVAKRCIWILQEQTRRRAQSLRDMKRQFKAIKRLPNSKQKTASLKKLLSELGQD